MEYEVCMVCRPVHSYGTGILVYQVMCEKWLSICFSDQEVQPRLIIENRVYNYKPLHNVATSFKTKDFHSAWNSLLLTLILQNVV